MVKRVLLVGLLGIGLIALVANQAWATASCPLACQYKYKTQILCTCPTTGGIYCPILGTGLGNVFKEGEEVYLGCKATTNGEEDSWVVLCGAPGNGNPAPGANVVPFNGSIENQTLVNATLATKNGKVEVTVHAVPDESLLQAIAAEAEILGIELCNNDNWYLVDAAPCSMTLEYNQKEVSTDPNGSLQICTTATTTYHCDLPDCGSLGVDPSSKLFEQRHYLCEQQGSTQYNPPIDCTPY
jgi:hypothetical protein